ncbi:MAG TPA: hypothetical protein VMM13_05660, partial [Euzebya sp.]|nr:hypothetical protein [Euzebya sp.]
MVDSTVGPVSLFPRTKFAAPRRSHVVVDRPALMDRLDDAVTTHPLTLLSATAGAGKTTLLGQWTERTDRPVAWIRLEAEDDDLGIVAAAVLEALEGTAGPDAAPQLRHALGGGAGDIRRLAGAIVNDLIDLPGLVLLLDDLHVLGDDEAIGLVGAVVDHLPERSAMIAATRVDPPGLQLPLRLARGQVAQLGYADLRLTTGDVAALLAEAKGDPSAADTLTSGCDGWAAAVRLALHNPNHVGAGHLTALPDLRRFLTEEVIGRLDPAVQDFLLRCSVLDELSPDACAAVDGCSAAEAQVVLDRIDAHNLLLAAVNDDHLRLHDLLRDHLREQLAATHPADVADLHFRAASVTPPLQAARHLLAADRPDAAADMIADLGLRRVVEGAVAMPQAWLGVLPTDLVDRHLRVRLVRDLGAVISGRVDEGFADLVDLVPALAATGDHQAEALARTSLAEAALGISRFDVASEQSGWLLPREDLPPALRARAVVGAMWMAFYVTDWTAVSDRLRDAFGLVRSPHTGRQAVGYVALGLGPELLFVDDGAGWVMQQLGWLQASGLVGPRSPGEAP